MFNLNTPPTHTHTHPRKFCRLSIDELCTCRLGILDSLASITWLVYVTIMQFFFMDFLYNFSLHMNRLSSVMMMSFLFSLVTGFGEWVSFVLKRVYVYGNAIFSISPFFMKCNLDSLWISYLNLYTCYCEF